MKIMRLPPGAFDDAASTPRQERFPPGATPPVGDTDLELEDVLKEVAILRCLDSPVVLRLREYFLSPEKTALYIVTDLLPGGQLLHALLNRGEAYSERDARAAFKAVREGG